MLTEIVTASASALGDHALDGPEHHKVLNKHDAPVTHVDFSEDGRYLQSTCETHHLTYTDLGGDNFEDASKKVASKECIDTTWSTWTCPFGWPVQGVWPDSATATAEVRACHRSPSGRYVATGDSAGRLKLYHHPVPKGAQSIEGTGHSSHVMNVRFSAASDECLVTCGGHDRCVLRWGIS